MKLTGSEEREAWRAFAKEALLAFLAIPTGEDEEVTSAIPQTVEGAQQRATTLAVAAAIMADAMMVEYRKRAPAAS